MSYDRLTTSSPAEHGATSPPPSPLRRRSTSTRNTSGTALLEQRCRDIYGSLGTKLGESAAVKVNFDKYPRGGDDGEKKSCVKKDGDADDATMVRSKRKNRTNES